MNTFSRYTLISLVPVYNAEKRTNENEVVMSLIYDILGAEDEDISDAVENLQRQLDWSTLVSPELASAVTEVLIRHWDFP